MFKVPSPAFKRGMSGKRVNYLKVARECEDHPLLWLIIRNLSRNLKDEYLEVVNNLPLLKLAFDTVTDFAFMMILSVRSLT